MQQIEVSGGGASGTRVSAVAGPELSEVEGMVDRLIGLIDRLPVAIWAIGIVAGSLAFMAVAAGLMAVVMLAVLA